jgi:hypothetical protein
VWDALPQAPRADTGRGFFTPYSDCAFTIAVVQGYKGSVAYRYVWVGAGTRCIFNCEVRYDFRVLNTPLSIMSDGCDRITAARVSSIGILGIAARIN